jgi:hypothetical protein
MVREEDQAPLKTPANSALATNDVIVINGNLKSTDLTTIVMTLATGCTSRLRSLLWYRMAGWPRPRAMMTHGLRRLTQAKTSANSAS